MTPWRFARGAGLTLALAGLVAGALVAAACGGDDDDTAPAPAQSPTQATAVAAKPITIVDASARATTNDVSAVYFTVKNTGPADRLVKASTDVSANTQIHEMVMQGGTAKMQQVQGLDVPANGELVLKPGGYHVMLLDLKTPLKEGQTVKVDLQFEKAGTITVNAPVKPYGSEPGMSGGASGGTPSGGMMATPTKAP